MFSFFKSNPIKKLTKLQDIKLEQAMQAQRNGDMKSFAQLTYEADEIEQQIVALKAKTKTS
ncbi:DUF6435 family protein [Thalassotalea agariperforans]